MPTAARGAPPSTHEPRDFTWQGLLLLLVGVMPVLASLALLALSPYLNFDPEFVFLLLVHMGFYTLAHLLAGPIEDGYWAGYMNLAVMVTWLLQGWLAALGAILGGAVLAVGLQLRLGAFLKLSSATYGDTVRQAGRRSVISASAVLVAEFVYRIFNGTLPLKTIGQGDILPLFVTLFSSWLVIHLVGAVLASQRIPPEVLIGRLWPELTLLPLIAVLPIIRHSTGIPIFIVVLLALGAQAIHYSHIVRQASESTAQYNQSARLVEKLALINHSIENGLFNFDQHQTVKMACQTALDVTSADKAAIFLLNHQQDSLLLETEIGFSDLERQHILRLPYRAARASSNGTRVYNDTLADADLNGLTKLAQRGAFRAYIEMPLRSGHLVLGYLMVFHQQSHEYNSGDLDLLEIVASQVATALDNAQLVRVLEMYTFETTHLVYLSNISNSSMEMSKVTADTTAVLRQMMTMDWAMMVWLDQKTSQKQILAMDGVDGQKPLQPSLTTLELPEIAQLANSPLSFNQTDAASSEQLRHFMADNQLHTLIITPMIAHHTLLGAMFLGKRRPYNLTDRDEQLLQTATNQVAAQLYNTQLYNRTYDELNRRLEQLAVIENIVRRIASSHDFTQIINDVFEAAVKTTHADMVALALLTEADDFWVIIHHYLGDGQVNKVYQSQPKDDGIIGQVVRTGQPILVTDDNQGTLHVNASPFRYASALAVPLTKDGAVTGVLNLESKRSNFFTSEQANFLKSLGGHAIIGIETVHLLEELNYQIDTLTNLRELSLSLSSAIDTSAVADAVLKAALNILHGQHAAIFTYHAPSDKLTRLTSIESNEFAAQKPLDTDVLRQVARHTAHTGEMQVIEDIRQTTSYQLPAVMNYPALITMPIKRGNRVLEVLCVLFAQPQRFENRDLNTLALLAGQAGGHLENAHLHEQIRAGSEQMRAILDSTPNGIILLDLESRLVEVNPRAEEMLDIKLSRYVGERFVSVLLRYANQNNRAYLGYSPQELADLSHIERVNVQNTDHRQFEQLSANQQTIYLEEVPSPVVDDQNDPSGRLLVLRDVTEERMLAAYREEITNMAIHDLRSPLASIINTIKLTRASMDKPDVLKRLEMPLGQSLQSAEKLLDLVNSMMDIAKLQTRQQVLNIAPANLHDVVESAYRALEATAAKNNIQIERLLPADLSPVNIDSDKVRRVFINLLDNALRFTPAGGLIQIRVTMQPGQKNVLVQVADSGKGIPPDAHERIFERYEQVTENQPLRGSKGTGLGLTFCKLVVEAQGGRIWVEPKGPLSGASFAFTLPLADEF